MKVKRFERRQSDYQGVSRYKQGNLYITIDWDRRRMATRYHSPPSGENWMPAPLTSLMSWEHAAATGAVQVERVGPPPAGRLWVEIGQLRASTS
jgi:hypothetical protein